MSEKTHYSPSPLSLPDLKAKPKSRITWIHAIGLTAFLIWSSLYVTDLRPGWRGTKSIGEHHDESEPATEIFSDWNRLKPSQNLKWTPCYHQYGPRFYCSRLTVPMDYSRPLNESANNPAVHIAVVMLAGQNHSLETRVFSDSPILFNPGGPGGPGTLFLTMIGPALQKIVGDHHDLVSFDPRAIGATTPGADCFMEELEDPEIIDDLGKRNALLNRITWDIEGIAIGLRGSSPSAIPKRFTRERGFAKLCQVKDAEQDDRSIFKYAGTPHVAQDMKSIIEAWDEWLDDLKSKRSQEADRVAASIAVYSPPDTKGKLVYWGFSYGTFLGATFASMFPQSVGRLVLDGVVDTDVYFPNEDKKDAWLSGIRDADAVFDTFFTYCFLAREQCQFFRHSDTKVGDIRNRYEKIMQSLDQNPLVVVSPGTKLPGILDRDTVKKIIFQFLYSPIQLFPILASLFDNFERGVDIGLVLAPVLISVCDNELNLPISPSDSLRAIGCSDRRWAAASDAEGFEDIWRKHGGDSSFTDVWMDIIVMTCAGWNVKVEDPPAIDWDKFPTDKRPPINTSFPIMFVSNTHDPVTPLHSGLIQSQRFAHSGLVEQLSEGHCSLAAVSLCTIKKIQAYINKGKVPKHPIIIGDPRNDGPFLGLWEKCFPDERPWMPLGSKLEGSEFTIQDTETSEAWTELRKAFNQFQQRESIPQAFRSWTDPDSKEAKALQSIRVSSMLERST